MKTALFCAAALLLACSSGPAQTNADFSTPASLAAQLHQLELRLTPQSTPQIRAALPSVWKLQTADGDYSISTAPLRTFLDRYSASAHRLRGASERALTDARNWLDHLAAQIDSFQSTATPPARARSDLERILSRPEFAGNAPPNAWERFWQRVFAALARWLKRLLAFAGVNSAATSTVFWVLLAGAVSLIAFFLFRLWTRDAYHFKLSGSPLPSPTRTSRDWLVAARTAASNGDLRSAIQCAYWAGVTRLQEIRVLPQNTTYTPREYLRLLASPPEALTALAPLRTLTSYLERFWYARAAATPDDFSACLSSLEALGCQVD